MSDFYLQLDLDAIKRSTPLARASGITQPEALSGLILMWEYCWYSKSDQVKAMHLAGFFSTTEPGRLAEALESFGFLEPIGDDASCWRVKGAHDRILRVKREVSEGRRKGGQAAIKNLKQFAKPPKKPKQQPLLDAPAAPPKERKPSEWQEAWEMMAGLAIDHATTAGIAYEPEPIDPAELNTRFKKAADAHSLSADDLAAVWQLKWLGNPWAEKLDPPYALNAFLSPKTLPKLVAAWSKENAELAEFDRQQASANGAA